MQQAIKTMRPECANKQRVQFILSTFLPKYWGILGDKKKAILIEWRTLAWMLAEGTSDSPSRRPAQNSVGFKSTHNQSNAGHQPHVPELCTSLKPPEWQQMSIYWWDVRKSVRLLLHADDELPALWRSSPLPSLSCSSGCPSLRHLPWWNGKHLSCSIFRISRAHELQSHRQMNT